MVTPSLTRLADSLCFVSVLYIIEKKGNRLVSGVIPTSRGVESCWISKLILPAHSTSQIHPGHLVVPALAFVVTVTATSLLRGQEPFEVDLSDLICRS